MSIFGKKELSETLKGSGELDRTSEPEGKQEGSEQDNYLVEIDCVNCQDSKEYDIPSGTTVAQFSKDKKCVKCGCKLSKE